MMRPALCVSMHDVAPHTWPLCETLLAALDEVARVPVTLLVVPDYHGLGAAAPDWYRAALEERLARGDELALHGYRHVDDSPTVGPGDWLRRRIYTAGEGEFAALPRQEARFRLALGRAWFGEQDWPLRGFVAPAWLLGKGAWQALQAGGFSYTTTLSAFHLLAPHASLRAPCIAYSTRSATRRALSLAWNAALLPMLRSAGLARLALHPSDALHPALVRQAQSHLAHLLRERTAMTKAEFAAGLRQTQQAGATSARLSPPPSR